MNTLRNLIFWTAFFSIMGAVIAGPTALLGLITSPLSVLAVVGAGAATIGEMQ